MRYALNFSTFLKAPSVLFRMSMKAIDVNQIHPEKLSGNKVIATFTCFVMSLHLFLVLHRKLIGFTSPTQSVITQHC